MAFTTLLDYQVYSQANTGDGLKYPCSSLQVNDELILAIPQYVAGGGNIWFSYNSGTKYSRLSGPFGTGLFGTWDATVGSIGSLIFYRRKIQASDLSNSDGTLESIGYSIVGTFAMTMAVWVFRGGVLTGASDYTNGQTTSPADNNVYTNTAAGNSFLATKTVAMYYATSINQGSQVTHDSPLVMPSLSTNASYSRTEKTTSAGVEYTNSFGHLSYASLVSISSISMVEGVNTSSIISTHQSNDSNAGLSCQDDGLIYIATFDNPFPQGGDSWTWSEGSKDSWGLLF